MRNKLDWGQFGAASVYSQNPNKVNNIQRVHASSKDCSGTGGMVSNSIKFRREVSLV